MVTSSRKMKMLSNLLYIRVLIKHIKNFVFLISTDLLILDVRYFLKKQVIIIEVKYKISSQIWIFVLRYTSNILYLLFDGKCKYSLLPFRGKKID